MRPFELFLYVAVVFGWSTSWYPLSLQLGVVAPEVSIFWRFLVSSLMMLAITALCGIRLRFEPGEHLRFLFLGMALFSTNFALFYNSSLYLASGLLAVILSMSSLVNVALVAAINRRPPPLPQVVAAIVGLVGLGLIFAPEFKTLPTAGIAVVYGVLATFSFCIGNLLSSRSQQRGTPVLASTSGDGYGTLFMGIALVPLHHRHIAQLSFSLAWLILVSSVMTCLLSQPGRATGPGRAAYATVVFLIFALLISARRGANVQAPGRTALVTRQLHIRPDRRVSRGEGRGKRPGGKRHHRAERQHVSEPHIPAEQSGSARRSTLQHSRKPGIRARSAVRVEEDNRGQAYSAGSTDQMNQRGLRSPCMASSQCTAPTKLRITAP